MPMIFNRELFEEVSSSIGVVLAFTELTINLEDGSLNLTERNVNGAVYWANSVQNYWFWHYIYYGRNLPYSVYGENYWN